MGAVKIDHADPAEHRAGIMQQLRQFWMHDHLCDVMLKSSDGTVHRAHMVVLSTASKFFETLLGGPFLEAKLVQDSKPVSIAASKEAVTALLDYIYDGHPEVPADVGLELLRLADAWDLPKLLGAIEAGILASLDSSVALQVLQEEHGLDSLRTVCEDKVAEEFEACSQHPDLGKLSVSQLARLLKREDLAVYREEAVVRAILNWIKVSEDRRPVLGMLLQHVQIQSLSVDNVIRLGRTALFYGLSDELQKEVQDALASRGRTQSPGTFQSKRDCLKHWSPFLGASTESAGREVLSFPSRCLRWHQDTLFAAHTMGRRILSWKPGEAGESSAYTLGSKFGLAPSHLAISPSGQIFVSDERKQRLYCFHNGTTQMTKTDVGPLYCSANGVLYMLTKNGKRVEKVVDSRLETVVASESLPADMQFQAYDLFVTKEEVIYLVDNLNENRILRIDPADSLEPTVVGQMRAEDRAFLSNLVVTEAGIIFVSDLESRKVFALHPGSPTFTEVWKCPGGLYPRGLLVHDRSLYVSMDKPDVSMDKPDVISIVGKVYEIMLPPDVFPTLGWRAARWRSRNLNLSWLAKKWKPVVRWWSVLFQYSK